MKGGVTDRQATKQKQKTWVWQQTEKVHGAGHVTHNLPPHDVPFRCLWPVLTER